MAQNRTSDRDIPRRGLSVITLFAICGLGIAGTSAVLLGASSTAAFAHGGGFRGGFGFGYWGPGYGYPYGYIGYDDDVPSCYLVRRRILTRHGWRIRRV